MTSLSSDDRPTANHLLNTTFSKAAKERLDYESRIADLEGICEQLRRSNVNKEEEEGCDQDVISRLKAKVREQEEALKEKDDIIRDLIMRLGETE